MLFSCGNGVDCTLGPDACDADQHNWTAAGCASCTDADGDGLRGTGCDLPEDCDDTARGIAAPCQANGCPQGWIHIPAGDFEMGCNSGELDNRFPLPQGRAVTVTGSAG